MAENLMEREDYALVRTLDLKELSDSEFEDAASVYTTKHLDPQVLGRLKIAAKRQTDARARVTGGI